MTLRVIYNAERCFISLILFSENDIFFLSSPPTSGDPEFMEAIDSRFRGDDRKERGNDNKKDQKAKTKDQNHKPKIKMTNY